MWFCIKNNKLAFYFDINFANELIPCVFKTRTIKDLFMVAGKPSTINSYLNNEDLSLLAQTYGLIDSISTEAWIRETLKPYGYGEIREHALALLAIADTIKQ